MPSGLEDQFHVGAERPHRLELFDGKGVRADDPQRVPLDRADEGQRAAGAAAGVLDDRLAGCEATGPLCALDHGEGHPVLVRAGRVVRLELDPDLGHPRFHDPAQPDDRRGADRGEDARTIGLRVGHRQRSSRVRPRSAGPAPRTGSARGRRRLEHQVAPRLRLREGHHLADVGLLGQQRRPAVDAERDPAVRRRPVLERVEHGAELLAHPLDRSAPGAGRRARAGRVGGSGSSRRRAPSR